MSTKRYCLYSLLNLFIIVSLISCGGSNDDSGKMGKGSNAYKDQVIIHNLSDAKGLNTIVNSDARATVIANYLFQRLLNYDIETMDLVPVLAKELPTVEVVNDGKGMEITYEIRELATWPNGEPITAKDVIWTHKATECPGVNSQSVKPYLEFIQDIRTYDDNPRKLTFVCDEVYMLADHTTGYDLTIMPSYIYDPNGVLDKYSYKDLKANGDQLKDNDDIKSFATLFNSEAYSREAGKVVGSGPYDLTKWETDQRIIIERKKDWWGDKVTESKNHYFEAYPKVIVNETINDFTTAVTALKGEQLDVMLLTPVKAWMDLDESDKFNRNFMKSEPPMLTYTLIGYNTQDKILKDKNVRLALSHLIDVDKINEKILYGQQKRIVGDVLPVFKDDYNKDIKPREYNPEKAEQLLKDSGWNDTDKDGIYDKVIDGRKTDLKLTYNYNSGNSQRENVGLMMQEWWKTNGIDLSVEPMDWSVYLEELKKNNVQLFYSAWISDPRPNDPKQLWHTDYKNGGSNYPAYGTPESDALIDAIRRELDPAKRSALYMQWQQMLHDDVPCQFLFTQNYRNIIHKRFTNLTEGPVYPGYWAPGFKLKEGYTIAE